MGAGDVKLLAGVGAWVWATATLYAFCVSALVGGLIAVAMVLWRRDWHRHFYQFWTITNEILEVRDPNALSAIAAERKSTHVVVAVRDSDRHRINCLFSLDGDAAMIFTTLLSLRTMRTSTHDWVGNDAVSGTDRGIASVPEVKLERACRPMPKKSTRRCCRRVRRRCAGVFPDGVWDDRDWTCRYGPTGYHECLAGRGADCGAWTRRPRPTTPWSAL